MNVTGYVSLKKIRGRQVRPYEPEYEFVWEGLSADEARVQYLWIYQENDPIPQMFLYSNCIHRKVQAAFRNGNGGMLTDIRKTHFLIFASTGNIEPSPDTIRQLASMDEYICDVPCGAGTVFWHWEQEKGRHRLVIDSDKNIEEGILYYDYLYGTNMVPMVFDIPGHIRAGTNVYENIYFPDLPEEPELKSRGENIHLEKKKKKFPFKLGVFHKS